MPGQPALRPHRDPRARAPHCGVVSLSEVQYIAHQYSPEPLIDDLEEPDPQTDAFCEVITPAVNWDEYML